MENKVSIILNKITQLDYDTQVGIYAKIQTPLTSPFITELHKQIDSTTIKDYNSQVISFIKNRYEEFKSYDNIRIEIENILDSCVNNLEKNDYLTLKKDELLSNIKLDFNNLKSRKNQLYSDGYKDEKSKKEINLLLELPFLDWLYYLSGREIRKIEVYIESTRTNLKNNRTTSSEDLILSGLPRFNIQQRIYLINQIKELSLIDTIHKLDTKNQTAKHNILAIIMDISVDNAKKLLNNSYKTLTEKQKDDVDEYLFRLNYKQKT